MRYLRRLFATSFAIAVLSSCGGGGNSGPPPPSITAQSPPAGTTGAAYAGYTFYASGGTAPFSWSESGSLPPGLALSASGQLSGTPATAGTYPISVTATDSSMPPLTASTRVSLQVNDSAIVIAPASPPAGTVTYAYPSFGFSASGGSAPYTWKASGTLPPGLTLGSDGTVSGTPTQTGAFAFSVTATDSAQQPMSSPPLTTQILVGKPGAQTLMITSPAPPNGADYTRYNQREVASCNPATFFCRCVVTYPNHVNCSANGFQLMASYGAQPYSWKWAATTKFGLPPGLNLISTGLIEGSPTIAGSYGVVVTVTDSSQPTTQTSANYTIIIRPPSPPQFQTVSALAVGVNVPASFSFSATGGQTPLTWSETGALPVGFSLSQGGVLSGTPTGVGSFPIRLDVQDSAGQSATPQNVNLVVTAHGFAMTGSMSTARSQHTATLLDDGTVLIAGGNNNGIAIAGSELYSGADAGFSQSGALGTARYSHTATLLGTGQVLVTGGNDSNGLAMASAELYDPSTKTFTALGNMASARASHTETLLGNGKVLLTGGATQSTYGIIVFMEATAELFDPATRSFSATGSMSTPRAGHTATLLSTGKVLVVGGLIADGQMTASAELYDPTTGTFTLTGAMHDARYAHTATLLANGTVLVTGGIDVLPNQAMNQMLTSAEIYDPKSGSFTTTGSMGTGRSFHAATLVGDASVLVVGGLDQNGDPLLGAELYSPGTGQFSLTGGLQIPSDEHTATVLRNGTVLVAGGNNSAPPGQEIVPGGNASGSLAAAELYR